MHTVHITSGSSLGAQNNKCLQLIKKSNKERKTLEQCAVVEWCLYKCIGFAASYPHKSVHVFICYALKKLWYRVKHNRNMSGNTIYFIFCHLVRTQRSKYMARQWKCVSFNKIARTQTKTKSWSQQKKIRLHSFFFIPERRMSAMIFWVT